ncbi:MAG: sulfatase-like hydrolase/transferase, partial [Bacteroidia bacterium]
LNQFFNSAKKESWYNNTLFVLCGDHASISENAYFSNVAGNQNIPILFFKGDNSLKETNDHSFSQMDILPSTLDLLGYNKPFFALGRSFTETNPNKSYFYANSTHYVYTDTTVYSFSAAELKTVFNFKRDSLLKIALLNKYPDLDTKTTEEFKVFIQTYNQTLISNSGYVK